MEELGKYTKREVIEVHSRHVSLIVGAGVAVVGLVFALGVLVGSRQREEMRCPAPDPLAELDARSKEPEPPPVTQKQLSFYESLSAAHDPVPTPASLLTEASASSDSAEDERAVLLRPRHSEEPMLETVRGDEPGVYSLQVGSFRDRAEASEMARKLERAGHPSFLVSVNMPDRGGMWYRVRVGPFDSNKEAQEYKRGFEERERLPAFVVKRRIAQEPSRG